LLRNFPLPKYFGIPSCFALSFGTEILRDPELFNIHMGTITLVAAPHLAGCPNGL